MQPEPHSAKCRGWCGGRTGSTAPSRNGSLTKPPACDLPHLQEILDGFRFHYNRERPHQGIGNLTPAERYIAPTPIIDGRTMSIGFDHHGEPIYPPKATMRSVWRRQAHLRQQADPGRSALRRNACRIVADNGLVHIYWGEEHIRSFTIDPNSSTKEQPSDN